MSVIISKRIWLLAVSIFLFFNVQSQFQRIGVPGGQVFIMEALSNSLNVASYCMDLDRYAPSAYKYYDLPKPTYNKILTPESARVSVEGVNGTLNLKQAVDKGYLKYTIDEFDNVGMERGPMAKGKIKVEFVRDCYWGNGIDKRPTTAIPKLPDPVAEHYFGALVKQDIIWYRDASLPDISEELKEIQTFFKFASIHEGPIDGKVSSTVIGVKEFNKKLGLPETTPWNWKNADPIYDILDDLSYLRDEKSIPGFLFTDKNGVSHFLAKKNDGSINIIEVSQEGTKNKFEGISNPTPQLVSDYELEFANQIRATNTEKISAIYVSSIVDNKLTVTVGNESTTVTINGEDAYAELISFIKNKLKSSEKTKFVMVADEFKKVGLGEGNYTQTIIQNNGRGYFNLPRLAHDLQAANNEIDVFITSDLKAGFDNISSIPFPKSNSDLTLLMPEKPLDPIDKIPADQLRTIQRNGLDYLTINDDWADLENLGDIAVFMGNKSDQFFSFLYDMSYLLEDKFIIAFTCHSPKDMARYAELIKRGGIKGILFYPDLIDPGAVRLVLQKLGKAIDPTMPPAQIRKAIEKAVDDVLKDSTNQPPGFQNQIRKLKTPVIQVFEYKFNHNLIFLS